MYVPVVTLARAHERTGNGQHLGVCTHKTKTGFNHKYERVITYIFSLRIIMFMVPHEYVHLTKT